MTMSPMRTLSSDEAARLLKGIRGLSFRPDGSLQLLGTRESSLHAIREVLQRRCDVTVHVDGLESVALPKQVRAAFDFAVDAGVPIRFSYRDHLLQVTSSGPAPAA